MTQPLSPDDESYLEEDWGDYSQIEDCAVYKPGEQPRCKSEHEAWLDASVRRSELSLTRGDYYGQCGPAIHWPATILTWGTVLLGLYFLFG